MSELMGIEISTRVEGATITGTLVIKISQDLEIIREADIFQKAISELRMCVVGNARQATKLVVCEVELKRQERLLRKTVWREKLFETIHRLKRSRENRKEAREVEIKLTRFRVLVAAIELQNEIERHEEDFATNVGMCRFVEEVKRVTETVKRLSRKVTS